MPHEINQRDGRASVFVTGEPAWHGLGTVLANPATAEEAIQEAGLGWKVIKKPLYAGLEHRLIAGRYAMVRSDDWQSDQMAVLGIVGEGYTPLQNADAFK